MLNPLVLGRPVLAIGSDRLHLATATLLSRSLLLFCRTLLVRVPVQSLDILDALHDGLAGLSRSETVIWVDLLDASSISLR